jgi:hypothetical protein
VRHIDAETLGWHAPRFCAAWRIGMLPELFWTINQRSRF